MKYSKPLISIPGETKVFKRCFYNKNKPLKVGRDFLGIIAAMLVSKCLLNLTHQYCKISMSLPMGKAWAIISTTLNWKFRAVIINCELENAQWKIKKTHNNKTKSGCL